MNQEQKKINNFCIEINRIKPTTLMNCIEIDPVSIEQTRILCSWFRIVLCIKEYKEDELYIWEEQLKGIKNIIIMNVSPLEAYQKFRDEEFIDFLFFNNGIHIDFLDKIYDTGFISGRGKQNIIKRTKYINGFWYAKKGVQ